MRCSDNRVQQLLDQPDLFARWQKNETEEEGGRERAWGRGKNEAERKRTKG